MRISTLILIIAGFIATVVVTMIISNYEKKSISEKRAGVITIVLGIEGGIALSITIILCALSSSADYTNKMMKAVSDNIKYCIESNYTTEDMVAYVESVDLYTDEPLIASIKVDEESLDSNSKYISFYVVTEDGVSVVTEPKSREGGAIK